MPIVRAERDPALGATVVVCNPLYYTAGADAGMDRPAHVRAASGLAWWGSRLALVQDDAHFVALVTPSPFPSTRLLEVEAVPLPSGEGGARVFGDDRGTKHLKLDLEAAVALTRPGGDVLLAFGSGSSPARERVVVATPGTEPVVVQAPALYARLRMDAAFAGSELNVEGAVLLGDRLRLFNRGNGAPGAGRLPVNASADLDLAALEAYLFDPDVHTPPSPLNVTPFDLGQFDGLRLAFTDAALTPEDRLLVTAAAEDSPDATRDGRVAGSVIGVVEDEGERPARLRWAELRKPDGTLFLAKVEGVSAAPEPRGRVYLTLDADDPARPAALCVAELTGPW